MKEIIFLNKSKINIFGRINNKKIIVLIKKVSKIIFKDNFFYVNIIFTKKKKILKLSKKYIKNCNGNILTFNYNFGRLLNFYKSDIYLNSVFLKSSKYVILINIINAFSNCFEKEKNNKIFIKKLIYYIKEYD
ncbi:hypothetical protein ACWNX6_00075 [Candidatus Vidania fulgoroideorum]